MITSIFGRKFLSAYNKKYGTDYDAKTFFIEKFYSLFFDHEKYMMTAGNSPLENPKISWDKMILGQKPFETPSQRKERFNNLIDKIENSPLDASIALGYPSLDINATTSGQISNISELNHSTEDAYLSWIGAGLGTGVEGGFSILFENDNILLDIAEGWELYRKSIDNTSNMKGNQVSTWNGQWLTHRYSPMYDADNPIANFNPCIEKDGLTAVDTQSWTKLLFGISRRNNDSHLIGYIYSFGQTNKTIGFIPFDISGIRRSQDLYIKFFGIESGKKAESIWGTAFGFATACKAGAIGIRALEPKGLKEYIYASGKSPKVKRPSISINDEQQILKFNVYKIWIMAMLENENLWDKSKEFAQLLHEYAASTERGKKDKSNKVESVLNATNKIGFIKELTEIVKESEDKETLSEMAHTIASMPTDNVPYFLTLIRFNYAAIK